MGRQAGQAHACMHARRSLRAQSINVKASPPSPLPSRPSRLVRRRRRRWTTWRRAEVGSHRANQSAPFEPRAHQPWALCDGPRAHQPWALRDQCVAGSGKKKAKKQKSAPAAEAATADGATKSEEKGEEKSEEAATAEVPAEEATKVEAA